MVDEVYNLAACAGRGSAFSRPRRLELHQQPRQKPRSQIKDSPAGTDLPSADFPPSAGRQSVNF